MDKDLLLRVGVITNSHGLKGEVKVYPTTDDIKRFDYLKESYIDTKDGLIPVNACSAKYFKNMVILKFEEFSNIDDILKFKGCDLLVDRDHAIKLEDGQFFVADILGCKVITDEDKELGIVSDVIQTGANDVYEIKLPDGKKVLFPDIDECVLLKDIDNKTIRVHVMKGLMD